MESGPHSTVRESLHTAVMTQVCQTKKKFLKNHIKKKEEERKNPAPGLTASVTLVVQMSCFATLLTGGYNLLFKSLSAACKP